jgi:hypothetical protein
MGPGHRYRNAADALFANAGIQVTPRQQSNTLFHGFSIADYGEHNHRYR